ncbi:MAG: formylglycine-generating enzyme family protein [Deltaproteobacteria bacterium]|nr:formylglycine-generating enzyme family protein [Deltaproteobacteria bacterium]
MMLKIFMLVLITVITGCSAYIDDFYVDYDGTGSSDDTADETDSSTDTNSESSNSTDDSGNTGDTGSDNLPDFNCDTIVSPVSGVDISFCSVEGGSFNMGCDESVDSGCYNDELPLHSVSISPFLMARLEVTNSQYEAFVTANPLWAAGGISADSSCNYNYLANWVGGLPKSGEDDYPVVGVCYDAAVAFCKWAGTAFDLPTQAQWEAAARKRDAQYALYPNGNDITCGAANFEGCAGSLQPVGISTGLSPYGVADMSGNAMEWTKDQYVADYYCDPEGSGSYVYPDCNTAYDWTDPVCEQQITMRTVKGGSYFHPLDMMRVAKRTGLEPSSSSNLLGFRCVKNL